MDLQIRTQPAMQGFSQTGGAVKTGEDFPKRVRGCLKRWREIAVDLHVEGLALLPSPDDEGLAIAIELGSMRRQGLLQP